MSYFQTNEKSILSSRSLAVDQWMNFWENVLILLVKDNLIIILSLSFVSVFRNYLCHVSKIGYGSRYKHDQCDENKNGPRKLLSNSALDAFAYGHSSYVLVYCLNWEPKWKIAKHICRRFNGLKSFMSIAPFLYKLRQTACSMRWSLVFHFKKTSAWLFLRLRHSLFLTIRFWFL